MPGAPVRGAAATHAATAHAVAWIIVYLAFILGPLFLLLAGTHPPARSFWTELSAALGYAGLAMMGLQFGLTARFRYVTEPWGEDVIYHFHRQISLIAVALVVAHPIILFVTRPELLALLNSISAPWRARFAALSTYSLIALVVMALWRTKLRLSYEAWHQWHLILAVVAVFAGLLHMVGWSFYLDDPWKRAMWIGLTLFWIALLGYVRILRPLVILRRPYLVSEVRKERGSTWTLVMKPDGHAGFQFRPGQFGWLTVYGSPFKISAHPFSFSSSAAATDGHVEMSIRELGDFTNDIGEVPVGKRVYIDGPYGAFTIGHPADMHVLIAGGVGITPMLSMIRTLADQGDKRPVILLYGSKDWDVITFREELEALKARIDLTVVHVLENPPPGWTGERGFINAAVMQRHLPPSYADHEYFICGPDVMMDAIEEALGKLGVPLSKYHSERYSFV
jgi:predicted ferric reductase